MNNKFIVIGINYGGHDTSAALMIDGVLIAACEQERYSLEKHSRAFPIDAIEDCMSLGGIGWSDVNVIAYAFDGLYHIREAYLKTAIEDSDRIEFLINDIEKIKDTYFIEPYIRQQTGYEGVIEYYNHHQCHLASCYYPSGFEESIVVSYDGIGEIETGLLAVGRDGDIKTFSSDNKYPDSLGLIYSAVTFYLGWNHHCDEGIIMGLATYGDPNALILNDSKSRTYYQVFEEIIQETGDFTYEINRDWISYHQVRDKWMSSIFYDLFGPKRKYDSDVTQHHKNIAAALQKRLEIVVINQLRRVKEKYNISHLCLSGGVALNCSMNGKIEESGIFDEIFVQPASGDAGVSVGACYLSCKNNQIDIKSEKNHNFYLGSSFSNDDIKLAFSEKKIDATYSDNIFHETAKRLADGKIVGWFQGRAEFGPRALGNRSILTRPYPAEMKDYINKRVKFREEFRPFAPAVLNEYLFDYFDIDQESPHMLIACQAKEDNKEKIAATVHSDNSCRVQSVKSENNREFYELISSFYEITECPVVLNTSFNVKGQPIVNTPQQAIDCYLSTNIDFLCIGNYFIEK